MDGALSPARAETPVDAAALPVSNEARLLSNALKLSLTVAEWLVRSGHRDVEATRRFLNPRLAELSSPEKMADRGSAAGRIAQAIKNREKICVFGDYDCDGMTAAAIMTEALTELGGDVATLLASRFDGGYGVSATAVDKIVATGARLLVTCDCGSSDHPSLRELARRGLECIVIDHHLVPEEPLPAFAFLNPHRPDCGFDYKGLASCGLALSMAGAVRTELGRDLDLKQWLDLVAIGTIADVAPLDGDNRALVRAGLRALGDAKRPGLRALLEQSRFDFSTSLGSEDISYRIAPRLNAPGRLGSPDLALRLLLERSPERAYAQALEIEQLSLERRATQDRMLAEALLEIEEQGYSSRSAIVVGREGWNHGIVGIVAGRLAAQHQKPVIVFGFERGQGRGSVRGPLGSRLHDMLTEASDVLVRFGGHQAAAGCEVRIERLTELRERFERAASNLAPGDGAAGDGAASNYLWLQPGEDPARVVADLSLLEPFGTTNPAPDLAVNARVLSAREVTGGHLKLELELGSGRRLSAFGPTLGHRAADLGERVAAAGKLRKDTYRGGDAVELKVDRFL